MSETSDNLSAWLLLLISLVILTAFVTLPIKALSQRNDNWFKTTDDYENRADFNTGSTGLGTQGFGQEPQTPLGSGLMILTAIGAGYAFTKSKKMRKKAGLMVMAFAMVMGMTQWKNMELHGAIFLPAAGYRDNTDFDGGHREDQNRGTYYANDMQGHDAAWGLSFGYASGNDFGNHVNANTGLAPDNGRSVRLVHRLK